MWGLAAWVDRCARVKWRKDFPDKGEYTGMLDGRRVYLKWHERVVGHVCFGDVERYGHLKCRKLVRDEWVWFRPKERP